MRLIRLLKKDLAREAAGWVDKGLISQAQAEDICREYGIDFSGSDSRSFGYNLLILLGYLFIGLSLITLISANWDDIPRGVRMAGLLLLTAAAHGLALHSFIAGREDRATGLFLLGNLFYGASIILIAQIYHLGEHMPDGVFWWALGSLPIGVLLRNTWLTLFSSILAMVWFWMEFTFGFFPTFYFVFLAAGIYVLFQAPASKLLFLAVVAGLAFWFESLLSLLWADASGRLDFHEEHLLVSVAMFIFAFAFSHWLDARGTVRGKDYGALLALWTLRFGLITMLVLSFEDPWKELFQTAWTHATSMWIATGGLLAASLWLGHRTGSLRNVAAVSAFALVSMIAVVLIQDEAYAMWMQVAYNVALVAGGIAMIQRGVDQGISHYFFLGVATILLTAFMRYIDLIGDYIGGAILFMVLAALLLGAARYWKNSQQRQAGERHG